MDFWSGFLALDQNGDRTDGRTDGTDGRADGRDGRTGGRTDGRADGRDGRDGRTGYSFTVLLGRRNTVLQYYWDREIQYYDTTSIYYISILVY